MYKDSVCPLAQEPVSGHIDNQDSIVTACLYIGYWMNSKQFQIHVKQRFQNWQNLNHAEHR